MQEGGGIFIAAGPDVDGDVIAELGHDMRLQIVMNQESTSPMRKLAPADRRHPIFRAFGAGASALGLAEFRSVSRLAGAGCQTLARFTSGEPALLDCPIGAGHVLIFGSDLENRWNDFPVRATFVPFVQETVKYLAGAQPLASELLVADVPPGVPSTPGIATLPARINSPPASHGRVAVNVDPRESETGRISVEEFEAAITRLNSPEPLRSAKAVSNSAGGGPPARMVNSPEPARMVKDIGVGEGRVDAQQLEDRQHLWQYLLALMVAMLAVEGFVASRTA